MRPLTDLFLFLCAACISASTTQSTTPPATSQSSVTLVSDTPHGFELSYPAEWKFEEPFVGLGADHISDIPVRLRLPNGAMISVAVGETNVPKEGLSQHADDSKIQLERLGCTKVTNNPCRLDGVEARQLSFINNRNMQVLQTMAINAGKAYLIKFEAPQDSSREPLEELLKSFHFKTGSGE